MPGEIGTAKRSDREGGAPALSWLGLVLLAAAAVSNSLLDGLRMRLARELGTWPLRFWVCFGAVPLAIVMMLAGIAAILL